MKYIDIAVNLTSKKYENQIEEILEDSFNNDLESMIILGTSVNNSKSAQNIITKYPQYKLYFTAGIHPDNSQVNNNYLQLIKKILINPKCIAVGEIGLDYSKSYSNKNKQKQIFEDQVKLAIQLNKPVLLHERDASEDFINILSKYKDKIKGIVHCFTGNLETVQKYLDMGLYIGITGWICDEKRNKDLLEAIKIIPLDKLMAETDSPYLSVFCNNHLNVPKNIKYVVNKMAQVLNKNEEELAEILLNNTKQFFGI